MVFQQAAHSLDGTFRRSHVIALAALGVAISMVAISYMVRDAVFGSSPASYSPFASACSFSSTVSDDAAAERANLFIFCGGFFE